MEALKKSVVFGIYGVKTVIYIVINLIFIPIILVCCVLSRFIDRQYDIGIGPIPMINNVYFKKALEKKGYKVETIANTTYFITQEFDFIYSEDRHPIMARFPAWVFLKSLFRYRCVYIYFCGFVLYNSFLLRRLEPYFLQIANIRVVVMPYGNDSQVFTNARNILTEHFLCQDYPNFFKNYQRRVEADIWRWTKYADIVLSHQDCVDYMPYWDDVRCSLFGVDCEEIRPLPFEPSKTVRIFHAPNHRGIKGSKAVERAIENLKAQGYDVELVYKHGVPNKEIIALIHTCDIVVDQLVMGFYSMFAIEAMACGKPVVCYIRDDLKEFYEACGAVEPEEMPLISAKILTIENVLKGLIEKRIELKEIGRKSREYVEKYHSLDALGGYYDSINRKIGIERRPLSE